MQVDVFCHDNVGAYLACGSTEAVALCLALAGHTALGAGQEDDVLSPKSLVAFRSPMSRMWPLPASVIGRPL